MTAPSAPSITVRAYGTAIRVQWKEVTNAYDYKLYVGGTANPTTLEADVSYTDGLVTGWFQWTFITEDDPTYVRLTALNIGAEESGYSNEVRIQNSDVGRSFGRRADPFGNDRYPG